MTVNTKRKELMKRLLFVVPVIIAVAVVAMLVGNRKGPQKTTAAETARQVRTIRLQPMDVVPRAIGYGYVEPDQVWQVVPEVSGKIVAVLLTSLTTIAGLLPLLSERSTQAQVLIPLAVSIVFGLMASTVLVLIVVPSLYAILGDFGLTTMKTGAVPPTDAAGTPATGTSR